MKSVTKGAAIKITAYFVVTVVIGALLAPVLFHWGKDAVAAGTLAGGFFDGLHGSLDRAEFQRYFNRALQFTALLLAWPAIRWIGTRHQDDGAGPGSAPGIRLRKSPRRLSHFLTGFVLASGLLLLMGVIFVKVGFYRLRGDPPSYLEVAGDALLAGLAVGVLEEVLFRGVLLGVVLRTARVLPAMLFVSTFFAAVHFMTPPDDLEIPIESVNWTTGFWMLGQIFHRFAEPRFLMAEFATLFFVGWILCYTRVRTSSLWMAIGLHGGWVFGIKFYAPLTRRKMPIEDMMPWAGGDLKTGIISVVVVAVTGWIVWRILRRQFPGGSVFKADPGDPHEVAGAPSSTAVKRPAGEP